MSQANHEDAQILSAFGEAGTVSDEAGQSGPLAVLVCHGMGQQVRFEPHSIHTVDHVVPIGDR